MSRIPEALRQAVIKRANGCCEYCQIGRADNLLAHEVDHIMATKHGGETNLANLCLSCFDCNRHKGSDLTSIDPVTRKLVRLFNPRRDNWDTHFQLDDAQIIGLTPKGRATVRLLGMNDETQVEKRAELMELNRYPCESVP